MQIKSQFTDKEGKVTKVIYEDTDSFEHLLSEKVTQAYGVCFVGDKIVIVYSSKNNPLNFGEVTKAIIIGRNSLNI